jgi:RNA polymerase sigma-70 factor, ECF subfamily
LSTEDIYARFGAAILRRCRAIVGDGAAEDAAQEVFMSIMDKAGQVRDGDKLGAWVYQLTTRHCLNVLRAQKRRVQREDNDAVAAWQERPSIDPYQRYSAKDLVRRVTDGLDELSQQIFVYRYLDGMTLEEVAELCGRSVRTITTRMRRLEAHLSSRLEEGRRSA